MKKHLISWLSVAAGGTAMGLSWWFYSAGVNFRGLAVSGHPSAVVLVIFTLLFAVGLVLLTRRLPRKTSFETLLPASVPRGIGSFIGAVGIAISCVQTASFSDFFGIAALVLGVLAAVCLLFAGSQRLFHMPPHALFYGLVNVFFIVMSLNRCRQWGAQTQVLLYFFPLLAQIFLLLSSYQYTALCVNGNNTRGFVLCTHGAVFFCCAAFPAQQDIFYLTSALWLILDGFFFRLPQERLKE